MGKEVAQTTQPGNGCWKEIYTQVCLTPSPNTTCPSRRWVLSSGQLQSQSQVRVEGGPQSQASWKQHPRLPDTPHLKELTSLSRAPATRLFFHAHCVPCPELEETSNKAIKSRATSDSVDSLSSRCPVNRTDPILCPAA